MIAMLKRLAAPLVGGVLILLAVALLVASWQGAGRRAARLEAAKARGGQVAAAAGERASTIAVEAVAAQGEKEAAIATMDQENRYEILAQPDAGVGAGAAGDAGLRGLCRRSVYRDHPRCAGLRVESAAPAPR